jgi:hypothetical protein
MGRHAESLRILDIYWRNWWRTNCLSRVFGTLDKHGSSVRSARQRAARGASEVSLLRVERDSHEHGTVVSGVGVSHLRELQMHLDG